MPYITEQDKQALAAGAPISRAGDLTYLITKELVDAGDLVPNLAYFENYINRYIADNGESFQTFAEILGSITATVAEWERRSQPRSEQVAEFLGILAGDFYDAVVAPYEDQKLHDNGDVYP